MQGRSALELILGLAVAVCHLDLTEALSEVRDLSGNPDYRYVALNWDYDVTAPYLYGFQIHYCELQAWGPHRCRVKTVESTAVNNAISKTRQSRRYSLIIPGLRMATNYSFEVRPITTKRNDREYQDSKSSQTVVLATKGFSAKASLCLPQESEIEVSTGPYFAGRIAVEATDGERCTVDGDPNSPRDIYTLRISHDMCGSKVNETTVSTFVLVQENLPILTHSTRRFLVLCTYQPDTLTVRAKLNLPSGLGHDDEHRMGNRVDVDDAHSELGRNDVDLQDDSGKNVKVMRLQQYGRSMVDVQADHIVRGEPVAQFVLMMVLVVAGVGGFVLIIWWSVRRARRKPQLDDTSSCDESLHDTESVINFEIESVCGVTDEVFEKTRDGSACTDLYVGHNRQHCQSLQHI